MKNKEIGEKLGIRTGTVKIHLKHIFEKTGIRGRYGSGLALSGLKEKGLLVPALVDGSGRRNGYFRPRRITTIQARTRKSRRPAAR
jgi:hypothetical protein